MVTYVAASGGTSLITTGSVATAYPAGTTTGDRLFLQFSSAATFTAPSGWTVLRTATNSTIARTTVVCYRDYDGVATAPSIAVTQKSAWTMLAFRRASTNNRWMIRSEGDAADTASGTTITPVAATAIAGDASLIFAATRAVAAGSTGVTATQPTNWTEVSDNTTSSGTTAGLQQISTEASYRLSLTAGSVAPGAITFSQSAAASATHVIFGEDVPPTTTATTYRSAVSADAPTAWWHLNETGGKTFFDSVGTHHATVQITGSPAFSQAGLESSGGASIDFDATVATTALMQYGDVPKDDTAFLPTAITVEALFKSDGFDGNNRIIEYGVDAEGWVLDYNTSNSALLWWIKGTNTAFVYSAFIDTTSRHHIAVTYNSSTGLAIVYIDGVETGRSTGTNHAWVAPVNGLRIAGKPTGTVGTDGWNGKLAEVAVYNTVLSSTQVATHAAAAGIALAGAALPSTFGLSVSATVSTGSVAVSGDTAVAETFGLTAAADRTVPTASSLEPTFGLAGNVTKGLSASATLASAFGLSPAATRGSVGGAPVAGVFGLAGTASRGTSGDTAVSTTFGLAASATRTNTTDASVPASFGLGADTTKGVSGDSAASASFVLSTSATKGLSCGASLATSFGLAPAAVRGTTGSPALPSVFGLGGTATRGTSSGTSIPTSFGVTAAVDRATSGSASLAATFGLDASATRTTTADTTVTETFGLTPSATRGAVTGSSLPASFALQTDATRAVTGAASVPSTFGLAATSTRGTSGDSALPETFGLAGSATRGVTASSSLSSTFGLSVAASTGSGSDVPVPAAFGLAAAVTKGLSCGASVPTTFGLLVDAQIGSGAVITFSYGFGLQTEATRATTADSNLAAGFGLASSATRNVSATAAIAAVLGLASTAIRNTVAAATLTTTAGISAGAAKGVNADITLATTWSTTASTGTSSAYTADASLATHIGLGSAATKGLNTGAALPLAFGLLPGATRSVNAALTLEQVFGLVSGMTLDATTPGSVASSLALDVGASVGRTTGTLLAPALTLSIEAVIGIPPVLAGARGLPSPGISAQGSVATLIRAAGVATDPAPTVAAVPQAGIRARLVEGGDPLHARGT